MAILSGADSYRDIARFAKHRLKPLREWFGITLKRAPSKSNLGKIFCAVDRPAIERIFRHYSESLAKTDGSPSENLGFAIDGKCLKGSFDHLRDKEMLHLLSVFCTNNQLILGHVEIPEKTNEIPTAQALIKELRLPQGSVYTLDAMHCQKKPLNRSRKQKES